MLRHKFHFLRLVGSSRQCSHFDNFTYSFHQFACQCIYIYRKLDHFSCYLAYILWSLPLIIKKIIFFYHLARLIPGHFDKINFVV